MTSPHAYSFFETLLTSDSDTARTLQRRSNDFETGDRLSNEIETAAESVAREADRANDKLAGRDASMLRTLVVLLAYDNSRQFYEVRRLRAELSDRDAETPEELQRITELFVEIDAARQFLKTVVVERQLARLSRLLIYTGIPAVTIAAIGIFAYRDVVGLAVPHTLLAGVAATIIVTTLAPLAVLSSFILRVATIARQTAAYGPFVPESTD